MVDEMKYNIDVVETGSMHTCAISRSGMIVCVGHNGFGQLDIPEDVRDKTVEDISLGDWHGCIIMGDNNVECWGSNQYGQGVPNIGYA